MKLSDKWEIVAGTTEYVLIEHRAGRNPKTGEPTDSQHRTYHPSIEACAAKIAHVSGVDAVELEGVEVVAHELRKIKAAIIGEAV